MKITLKFIILEKHQNLWNKDNKIYLLDLIQILKAMKDNQLLILYFYQVF